VVSLQVLVLLAEMLLAQGWTQILMA